MTTTTILTQQKCQGRIRGKKCVRVSQTADGYCCNYCRWHTRGTGKLDDPDHHPRCSQ